MNNCVLDFKNDVRIPQNEKNFFMISKDLNWNNSIRVSFERGEEMDYLNLFFILKSYCYENKFPCYAFATCYTDLNEKTVITQKENILSIKNMDFNEFEEWINYRIKEDWKYDKAKELYHILVLFEKNIVLLNNKKYNTEILDILKPNYPWTIEWLDFFEKSIERVKLLEAKIKLLETKIKNN